MKQLITLFIPLLFCLPFFAQTNISGVINDYTVVVDIEHCSGELTVENPTAFQPEMKVVLIQMQGATMDESNDANFGNISNLGNAGLYEVNEIESILGNVISLKYQFVNNYNTIGKVQLVTMPTYADAIVDGELIAQPWDGFTGGILAFSVTNNLTLNSPINVSGAGFRGGAQQVIPSACNFLFNQDDYSYETGDWRGAFKGEGITATITGKEAGRGAQANGGGGGNDHNTGGGGGGNVVAGGLGGQQYPDGNFDCDGEFPGIGGKSFSTTSTRLFLGGGGGAGHTDNNTTSNNGGNGGGIVLIQAGSVTGNNQMITANGSFIDTSGDGGGGGGAGGTIVLDIGTITDELNIEANGGRGGFTGAIPGNCFGPGGGGSGGRILTNTLINLSANVSGGTAGTIVSPNVLCSGSSNGATAGNSGIQDNITGLTTASDDFEMLALTEEPTPLTTICEGETLNLTVAVTGGANLFYQWQVSNGGNFENMANTGNISGSNAATLQISNADVSLENATFQCIISNDCGEMVTSMTAQVEVLLAPISMFTSVEIANGIYQFNNQSANATSYLWNFGDNNTSTEPNPEYTYSNGGTYTVVLVAMNACGDAVTTQEITFGAAPTAAFSFDLDNPCAPAIIEMQNESIDGESYQWTFEGGIPATSTDAAPTVTYNNTGFYAIQLIVTNAFGSDTINQQNAVSLIPSPTADFTILPNDLMINFSNTSLFSDTYVWDFGDMETSTDINPTHIYADYGIYTVTLTSTGPCGTDTYTFILDLSSPLNAQFASSVTTGCVPVTVQFSDETMENATSWSWQFPGGTPNVSNEQNPTVVYSSLGTFPVALLVSNGTDESETTVQNYIDVEAFPEPFFDYTANGLEVQFNNLTSPTAVAYSWNFGDGTANVMEENPTHTYAQAGAYTVTLNANNNYCATATAITIETDPNATVAIENALQVTVFPNPMRNELTVELEEISRTDFTIHLMNVIGQECAKMEGTNAKTYTFDTANLPSGIYFLTVQSEAWIWTEKVVKE